MSFFDELKRRNVFRVGIAYIVIGWLLAQVAEFAFENFGAPDWVLKSFVVLLLLGLPIALIFAWAFEMTPEGIKLERDIDRSSSITRQTGRKLDKLIIAVLVVAVALLAFNQFADISGGDAERTVAAAPERSIAVLPFVDLSPDQTDEYFGKGIAEELLNSLAQFPGLRVAARTSAFSFAGRDVDLRQVGDTLDVAHVLEGSIRRSGERIRITAQLIRASDGFHLWSETYERAMTDIFTIQDDIVGELVTVLQIRLGIGAGTGRVRQHDVNTDAYEAYLRGLYLWASRHVGNNRQQAIASLRLSAEIDPDFADGWAAYALSMIHSAADSGLSMRERNDAIYAALQRALEIDPDTARAHSGLALYYGNIALDIDKSLEHAAKAEELAPNAASARYARASAAIVRGDYEMAAREMQHTRMLDPLNRVIERVAAQHQIVMGRLDEAERYFRRCEVEHCEGEFSAEWYLMEFEWARGNFEAATARIDRLLEFSRRPDDDALSFGPNAVIIDTLNYARAVLRGATDTEPPATLGTSLNIGSITVSALAIAGRYDDALRILVEEQENGSGFAYGFTLYPLAAGGFEFPDEFRRHPGYHEFWNQPGLRDLARARIANGHPEGLPLNEDGTLVEY